MKNIIPLLLISFSLPAQVQQYYTENKTPVYEEVIEAYQYLDEAYANTLLLEYGPTDIGKNLQVFYLTKDPLPDKEAVERMKKEKVIILINNGIHPGEPCGIDASIAFCQDLLKDGIPDSVLIAIIPVYNIGGALNRNAFSRANQQGPEEHGFRGNARNLDLNRDFIKADALNTRSFYAIYQFLQPHLLIDTHTSNGADYQYTMTLISTQKDKLNPVLAELLTGEMEPFLYESMESSGWEMTPYVNVFGATPDKGFAAFLETPRYASGYTALFHTIGFITEAHMLKSYEDRVEATRQFLHHITFYAGANATKIIDAKHRASLHDQEKEFFDLNWVVDSSRVQQRDFEGYEYTYEESEIGNYPRLKYFSDKPRTYQTDYYESFKATDSAAVPEFYIVPQAWHKVPLLMQYNGVAMRPLKNDTSIEVTSWYITEAEFASRPYEGHFPVQNLKIEKRKGSRQFFKGDYVVPTDQAAIRFIMNVLEPTAVDSYLRWNFYDEIFQQKEYFSPYFFEETAAKMLEQDEDLRRSFEAWKEAHPDEAKNPYAALGFIYRYSPHYEKEHMRYPVARVEK